MCYLVLHLNNILYNHKQNPFRMLVNKYLHTCSICIVFAYLQ